MENLMKATQSAAYFLWEHTRHDNALDLWYCAEDIAFYSERHNILSIDDFKELSHREKHDYGYLEFVRNISYRIYLSTGNSSSRDNWFITEELISNMEWCKVIVEMTNIYRKVYKKELSPDIIRSERIRHYYSE